MNGLFRRIGTAINHKLGLTASDAVACLVSVPTMVICVVTGLPMLAAMSLAAVAYALTVALGRAQ